MVAKRNCGNSVSSDSRHGSASLALTWHVKIQIRKPPTDQKSGSLDGRIRSGPVKGILIVESKRVFLIIERTFTMKKGGGRSVKKKKKMVPHTCF